MQDIIIEGRDGTRRRARKGEVLKDGERFIMPMAFMDAHSREVADHLAAKYGHPATGRDAMITDAYGHPAGHRPGYVFDSNRELEDAARVAYDERNERMSTAWMRKGEQQQADAGDAPPRTARSLDELQKASDAAYRENASVLIIGAAAVRHLGGLSVTAEPGRCIGSRLLPEDVKCKR